jgi:hypothetical protein
MTTYKCNHCDKEYKINFPPHEADLYCLKENKWYCKSCMKDITKELLELL